MSAAPPACPRATHLRPPSLASFHAPFLSHNSRCRVTQAKRKHRGLDLRRLPKGHLRPPSIASVVGSVVRFRKKKDWGASE